MTKYGGTDFNIGAEVLSPLAKENVFCDIPDFTEGCNFWDDNFIIALKIWRYQSNFLCLSYLIIWYDYSLLLYLHQGKLKQLCT